MERDGKLCSVSLFNPGSQTLQQGWKGSVKATHLVIALHEHFTVQAGQASRKTNTHTSDDGSAETVTENNTTTDTTTATLPAETPADDSWALQYINVRQIQPLIEAIDDDGSSFVTVNELNEFTSCRPEGWRRVHELTMDSFDLTYI